MLSTSVKKHLTKLSLICRWDRFYVTLGVILLSIFGIFNHMLWVLVCVIFFFQWRHISFILFGVCLGLFMMRFYMWEMNKPNQIINQSCIITQIKTQNYSDQLTISCDGYHLHLYTEISQYQLSEILRLDATIKPYRKQTRPFGFNAYTYHLGNNVLGYATSYQIHELSKPNVFEMPRISLLEQINQLEIGPYIKQLFFGMHDIPKETKVLYQSTGIWFLLHISGIHMFIIVKVIKKIMFYMNLTKNQQMIVICFIYLLCIYLSRDWVLWRLYLIFLMQSAFHAKKIAIPKIEIVMICYLMIVFFMPWLIYQYGFLLSLIILICLALLQQKLRTMEPWEANVLRSLFISIIIFLFISSIHLLQVLFIPLLIWIFGYVLLPLLILTMVLPFFDHISKMSFVIFETFLQIIRFDIGHLEIHHMPIWMSLVSIYMLLKLIYIKRVTHKVKYVLIIIIWVCIPYFYHQMDETKVIFLDVEQGDSSIIISKNCVIVIDAYQYVSETLIGYGIKQIDYLILTHAHQDHIKEAQDIIDYFDVDKILINPYDTYHLHTDNALKVMHGSTFQCHHIKLDVLGPLRFYNNSNNHSLVIQLHISGRKFLFTGDIEYEAEADLVSYHQSILKSGILKVAHHGSITSSSVDFIKIVQAKHVVMSIKESNRHGFPSQEVLKRFELEGSIVYRTDLQGTIEYAIIFDRQKWRFYMPY